MSTGAKPTEQAQERFERLPAMLPANVAVLPQTEDQPEVRLDGTIIDISTGGMCLRLGAENPAINVLEDLEEGQFVEVEVPESPSRNWTVLGRVAWVWAPTMLGEDQVGSLGIDIKGVAEDDRSFFGKVRRTFLKEREVEVDRTPKIIKTRRMRSSSASLEAIVQPKSEGEGETVGADESPES